MHISRTILTYMFYQNVFDGHMMIQLGNANDFLYSGVSTLIHVIVIDCIVLELGYIKVFV